MTAPISVQVFVFFLLRVTWAALITFIFERESSAATLRLIGIGTVMVQDFIL
jgi:hypothetical protein